VRKSFTNKITLPNNSNETVQPAKGIFRMKDQNISWKKEEKARLSQGYA
jgi:hypothetical protein